MIGQAERLYELNSLVKKQKQRKTESKVITFTSGKGGTGKSFISGNIAFQLSKMGLKVLLVDLDINFSNLSTMFNVKGKKNIYQYLAYNSSLEDVVFNYSDNLDIVFGESGKIDHPEFTEEKARRFLTDLNKIDSNYEYIIIDTSSGINKGSIQILLESDEIILVTTPEPTSVMDAYVIFKMLKNFGSDKTSSVIVNKTFNQNEGLETFRNLEMATKHFLKSSINYLGEISFSQEIIKSIQNQTLYLKIAKNSKVAFQLQNFCDKLRIPAIG